MQMAPRASSLLGDAALLVLLVLASALGISRALAEEGSGTPGEVAGSGVGARAPDGRQRATRGGTEGKSGAGWPRATRCRLAGAWVNDLGSEVNISAVDSEGRFSGCYLTAVSASENRIQKSFLQGVLHPGDQPTFGFAVNWTFSDSTTVFVGQCFVDEDGNEVLRTAWLLREAVNSLADDWKATRVGQNIFCRPKRKGCAASLPL